jgi:putative nucleotidyltransferase with HDIG domain
VFNALVALVTLAGASAAVASALLTPAHLRAHATALLLIAVLALGSDLVRQGVYDAHIVSPQPIFAIAAGVIGGPLAIPLLVLVAVAGVDVARGELRRATLVNCGSVTLAALAGAGLIDVVDVGARPVLALAVGAAAGIVYLAVAGGIIAVLEVPYSGARLRSIVRDTILWMTPYYALFGTLAAGAAVGDARIGVGGILVSAAPALAMSLSTRQYLRKTEASMARLRAANTSLAALLDEKRGLLDRLEHQHAATIRGLARAIDAKDPYTAGHTERVARYCVTLAVEMGLDEPTVAEIEHGAILHDIGKIGVPDAVLTKPSALAPDEWAQMRRHPEIACEILAGLELSQTAMDVIRSHHENVDGTGYPDGIAGAALSLPARVARVADAFDAMTSDRPYRAGMAPRDAVAELERCAGTQFSPDVVRVMKLLVWRGELETPVPRRLRRAS